MQYIFTFFSLLYELHEYLPISYYVCTQNKLHPIEFRNCKIYNRNYNIVKKQYYWSFYIVEFLLKHCHSFFLKYILKKYTKNIKIILILLEYCKTSHGMYSLFIPQALAWDFYK